MAVLLAAKQGHKKTLRKARLFCLVRLRLLSEFYIFCTWAFFTVFNIKRNGGPFLELLKGNAA